MIPFPTRLKEARKWKKLKQREMAERLGIITRSYQQYEGGQRRPDYETWVAIADLLEVSIDYLLGRTDVWEVTLACQEGDAKK